MSSSLPFSALALAAIALMAGALVPLQAGSNAALGRALGHPLWATLASLLISLLLVVPVLLVKRIPAPLLGQAQQMPLWVWVGGVAGVIYITSALMLTPRLGVTGFMVSAIAGQLVASLLIDHFGWVGLLIRPATFGRVAGVLLMLAGLLLVQWSTAHSANPTSLAPGHRPADTAEGAGSLQPRPPHAP